MAKPARHRGPIDLRIAANSRDKQLAQEAHIELKRRMGNLQGAVVPAWEKALRGPNPSRWAV